LQSRIIRVAYQDHQSGKFKPYLWVANKLSSFVTPQAILKTAKEIALWVSGLLCLIASLFLIKVLLPEICLPNGSVWSAIGIVVLALIMFFCAQRLIWKSLEISLLPCAPARSDFQHVATSALPPLSVFLVPLWELGVTSA